MKRPNTPPNVDQILQEAAQNANQLSAILTSSPGPLVKGKYLHWDQLLRYTPPDGLTHRQWWLSLKFHRQPLLSVPLRDKAGGSFGYVLPDPIPERLHYIDLGSGGLIQMPEQITNPDTRDRYCVGSLIEEAITSSQLEGAATTRQIAKAMIREGRPPRDQHEQMILNNFRTMQRIRKLKGESLTPELVLEIHRLVTERTLENQLASGRFRRPDEAIDVGDYYGEVYHLPPPAEELERRLRSMCDFANGRTPKRFVHPAIRAIILHFWLAYDHPFVDGNGRTARALFYWSMLRSGFWLFEFVSISQIILKAPARYARTFLYTETDDNDLTYFILYHLEVIRRAIDGLHEYISRKTDHLRAAESELRSIALLNHRQRALVSHALRHPNRRYTIESHRMSHAVVYQTARIDLLELRDRGILEATKAGKTWLFTPVGDLEEKLAALA